MDVVLGRERAQKSQVVKQADVVALLGLLPEEFVGDTEPVNFRYYELRCSHGGSLSPAMHGPVAARLGDTEMALRLFRQTAAIELADTHAATDGGIWMLAVFGFAGVSFRNDDLTIDPRLPPSWLSLTFRIQRHRRDLRITSTRASRLPKRSWKQVSRWSYSWVEFRTKSALTQRS
jgi:trehalose/maltose hydrolase-like predicted phosphorylase